MSGPSEARNQELYERCIAGESVVDLAAHYGITKQRVSQIVKAHARRHGLSIPDRIHTSTCERCGGRCSMNYTHCQGCRVVLEREQVTRETERLIEHYLLGYEEVGEALGISPQSVFGLIERGVLHETMRWRGRLVFSRTGVDLLRQAGYGDETIPHRLKNERLPTAPCPTCGQRFVGARPRRKYCTRQCKRTALNRDYYRRHRERVISKVLERRRQAKENKG